MIALKLSNYPRVIEYLHIPTTKVMATVIIQSIMKNGKCISTSEKVEALFELIKGLIKDSDGIPNDELTGVIILAPFLMEMKWHNHNI
ncbi:Vacuolar protein sorting-associated protein 35B [Glycine max]|nr:Vacuolar protein sorting-associated protein 35B [Glycine max]